MVPSADWSTAKLTAQEGFVLSRVDSNATLETLCLISGLGKQVTCRILRRLAELGLICIGVPGAAPAPPRVAASPSTQRTATARGVPAVQLPQPPPQPAPKPQARQRTPTPPFFQIPVIPIEGAAPSTAAPPR